MIHHKEGQREQGVEVLVVVVALQDGGMERDGQHTERVDTTVEIQEVHALLPHSCHRMMEVEEVVAVHDDKAEWAGEGRDVPPHREMGNDEVVPVPPHDWESHASSI
jgi:hypothetical protein